MSVESAWMNLMYKIEGSLARDGAVRPEQAARLGESAVAAVAGGAEPVEPTYTLAEAESHIQFMVKQSLRGQESDASEDFYDVLHADGVIERAHEAQSAMAETFGIPKEELNLVMTKGEQGSQQLVLMHTGAAGVEMPGLMSDLYSEQNSGKYVVEVGGEQIDARNAMTWQLYSDFVQTEKKLGSNPLPDRANPTLLTGEEVTGASKNLTATVGRMRSRPDTPYRDFDWRVKGDSVRFRPAVVVGVIEETTRPGVEQPADKDFFYFSMGGKDFVSVPIGGQVYFAGLGSLATFAER